MSKKKTISITTTCYNESGNITEWYERCLAVMKKFPEYDYEFVVADNKSTDSTRNELRKIAARDSRFRVILNSNNFTVVRSAHNAFLQAKGSAVICMVSDLQDPPELIGEFIRHWQDGAKVICGIKEQSEENKLVYLGRSCFYKLLSLCSDAPLLRHFTGFGLYDRQFVEAARKFNDPYPYFRGLVSEIGLRRVEIPFKQARRKRGKTTSTLFFLYDIAMTGFVNHTKLPLRLAAFTGFLLAALSLFVALGYLVYKLLHWDTFSMGMAPVVVGLFFFASVQLIFIGIIGEYVGAIWTQVKNKPLVIEEERINF
ncbi:MAG: glycosyltransferase family 2 protein [Syntrophaceae bacterium]|nr:glycosyltransferase family 2 protein [Syntrophaceae bacterium]